MREQPVPSQPRLIAREDGSVRLLPIKKLKDGSLVETKWRKGSRAKAISTASHERTTIHFRGLGTFKVHRLVCEAFHGPAPEGCPYVIHIDEDSSNNRPENLKWGTQKENLNMPKFINYCKNRVGEDSPVVKGRK